MTTKRLKDIIMVYISGHQPMACEPHEALEEFLAALKSFPENEIIMWQTKTSLGQLVKTSIFSYEPRYQ